MVIGSSLLFIINEIERERERVRERDRERKRQRERETPVYTGSCSGT